MTYPQPSEVLYKYARMMKIAEKQPGESSAKRIAKAIGGGTLGLGVGMGAGYGVGRLADAVSRKATGRKIPIDVVNRIIPLATAGMGTAGGLWAGARNAEFENAIKRK